MMEVVGCEDAGIEVAAEHETEVFHAGFEVSIGHRARVLEFTQDGIIEAVEIAVGDGLFDEALASVRLGVFFAGEPAEEVGGFVVEQIRDEMMTDTDVGFAVLVFENLTFTVKSKSHEHMTCLGALP